MESCGDHGTCANPGFSGIFLGQVDSVQAPRIDSVQSPRRDSVQVPGIDSVQASRGDSVQTPRGDRVQTLGGYSVQAARGQHTMQPPIQVSMGQPLKGVLKVRRGFQRHPGGNGANHFRKVTFSNSFQVWVFQRDDENVPFADSEAEEPSQASAGVTDSDDKMECDNDDNDGYVVPEVPQEVEIQHPLQRSPRMNDNPDSPEFFSFIGRNIDDLDFLDLTDDVDVEVGAFVTVKTSEVEDENAVNDDTMKILLAAATCNVQLESEDDFCDNEWVPIQI